MELPKETTDEIEKMVSRWKENDFLLITNIAQLAFEAGIQQERERNKDLPKWKIEQLHDAWRDYAWERVEKMFGKTMSKLDLEDLLLCLSVVPTPGE